MGGPAGAGAWVALLLALALALVAGAGCWLLAAALTGAWRRPAGSSRRRTALPPGPCFPPPPGAAAGAAPPAPDPAPRRLVTPLMAGGQAYGAKKYALVGVILQRAVIIVMLMCLGSVRVPAFSGRRAVG